MDRNADLVKYRFESAEKMLIAAKTLLDIKDYSSATNRSYYAVFHAMRSILALENLDFKKHSGVISHFTLNYIKPEKFGESSKQLSKIISHLFQLRGQADYEDFFVVSKKEVAEQVENAEFFLTQVKLYLTAQGIK